MKPNGPYVHDSYSRWFYESEAPLTLNWMGVGIVKCPYDLWHYTDIIQQTKPDLIIETGTFQGGSALYMAHVFDLLAADHWDYANDTGRVLSIDLVKDRELPNHPRVDYLLGMSSTSPEVIEHVGKAADGKRCMVILDSAHNRKHVLREMQLYKRFVAKGCYMIVEDTNVHGYPYAIGDIEGEDDGPAEAVRDFQPTNNGYEVDRRFERLGMSQNPGGYLLRVR
jgi:cephalosporin hydroxylase